MPRVHYVKKARKDHGSHIKKGESYYWWKFRYGPRMISKTRPKPSQLTQSEFLSKFYSIQEELEAMTTISEGDVKEYVARIEELADTCENNLMNMPDSLQDGKVGQLLQERFDKLYNWSSQMQDFDWEEQSPQEILDNMPLID